MPMPTSDTDGGTPTVADGASSTSSSPPSSVSSPSSIHPLRTILVWGPWVVALLALLGVVGVGWTSAVKTARLEGEVQSRTAMEIALRSEIQVWQAYTIAVQRSLIEQGVTVPKPPSYGVPIGTAAAAAGAKAKPH